MTMRFIVHVTDDKLPEMGRYITVTQDIVDEVEKEDPDRCIGLAKAILATYEKTGERKEEYLRIFNGHKFYLNLYEKDKALDEIYKDFMLHGTYEPHTTKLIESIVKEGDIAVDVGASIGYFTLLLARLVGENGKVYSIEPTENQFQILEKNIEINGYKERIQTWNFAAGDKRDYVNIQANASHKNPVMAIVLDDILPEKVDFIKIDVDGSEPYVLRGLIKTIEKNPQLKMVIEYYPEYIEKLGGNPQDVMDILNTYFILEEIKGDYGGKYWNYYCKRK